MERRRQLPILSRRQRSGYRGHDGARLINILSAGYNGATHHTFEIFGRTGLCSVWDTTGSYLLSRMRAALLLSKKMGLGAGNSSIKQISMSGVTTAVAAMNSAGNPVTAVANYSGASITVAVNFTGLGQLGTANLQTYLADFGNNTAQSPIENVNVPVSGGSLSHSITLTPYSVAGIILSNLPPTLTPAPTSNTSTDTCPYLDSHARTNRHRNVYIRVHTRRNRHFNAYCCHRSGDQDE